ncbi:MAG: hypothetical protein ACP5J4_03850 [Anaerolineae bacterium]
MKKLVTLTVLVLLLGVWLVGPVSANLVWPPIDGEGSITVHKFHDVNMNGVQDEGEEDIEGWLMRIYRFDGTGLYMVAEGYTDSFGMVTFNNLPSPTRYKVWEQELECWEPTTPNLSDYVWDGGRYTLVWTVSNETVSVEFGNVYTCNEACYEFVDETAWADGDRYTPRGNWGTYTPYVPDSTVILYAGQTMNTGTVHFSAPDNDNVTITINLTGDWEFAPVEENVKIQGYTRAPSGNPHPGRFAWKATASGQSFSITVPENNFYGVHVAVGYWMEVACPVP